MIALVAIWLPNRLSTPLERLLSATSTGYRKALGTVGLVVSATALMIIGRSKNHILGDGFQRLSLIEQPVDFTPTEYLDLITHRGLFTLIENAEVTYLLIGIVSGAILFTVAWCFARRIARCTTGRCAVVFIFAGLGTVQFFFGYAESYTIMTALLSLFCYFGWRAIDDGRFILPAILVFLLSAGFHLSAAFLFPALAYSLWARGVKTRSAIYKVAAVIMLLIGIPGAAISYFAFEKTPIFCPAVVAAYSRYTLFSVRHITDMANILLLVAPLPLIVCITHIRGFTQRLSNDRRLLFLAIAAASSLAFTLTVDPKLGAVRDWDLLALYSVPLAFFACALASDVLSDTSRSRAILLIGLAVILVHTTPWVYSNTDRDMTISSLKEIMLDDPHHTPEYFEGQRLAVWGFLLGSEYSDLEEFHRSLKLRLRARPDDQMSWLSYAEVCMQLGEEDKAVRAVRQISDLDYLTEDQLLRLGNLQMRLKELDRAKETAEYTLRYFPDNIAVIRMAGTAYQLLGEDSIAVRYYENIMARGDKDVDLLIQYAGSAITLGRYEFADSLLSMMEALPDLTAQDTADISTLRRIMQRQIQDKNLSGE
jgi:tetratricopeptide (TPR) repeat protein